MEPAVNEAQRATGVLALDVEEAGGELNDALVEVSILAHELFPFVFQPLVRVPEPLPVE